MRALVGAATFLLIFGISAAAHGQVAGGLTRLPGIYALGPNQAVNGDFETNDGTKPATWRTDAAWSIDSAVRQSGSVSLRLFDAPNVQFAQIALQQVQLRAGVYKLSGWIKTDNLGANTAGSGVRFTLDASAAGVTQRSSTPVVGGTTDWTFFERPNIVISSDRMATIKIEAYKEPSGTAWFDDVKLEEQLPPPVEAFLRYPNFRGMLFDGQPLVVRLELTVTPPGGDVGGHRVRVRLLRDDGTGTMVAEQVYPASSSFVAELDASPLVHGETYLVETALLDGTGSPVYVYPAYRVSRVTAEARAGMNIAFDDHNRVLINGTPRFVLGVYDSGSGYGTTDAFWENQLWSPTGERRMDGLRINFYLNYWYGQAPIEAMNALMSNLQRRGVVYLQTGNCFQGVSASPGNFQIHASESYVQAFGAHEGSAGYYTVDECDSLLVPEVHGQYLRLSRLDPDSMTFAALLGNPPEVFFWADSADVLSTDPYPLVGAEPASGYAHNLVADWAAIAREATSRSRPFMTVLQFFKFTSQGRWPTLTEMRNHAYMAIVEGARGLWWWSLGANALRDVCSGWCAEKTQHMNDLKAVVGELADLEPVLVADDTPTALTGNSSSGSIRTKVKVVNGRGYLIASNYTSATTSATFTWNKPLVGVTVHGEGRTIAPSGSSFTDGFGPYQAHVYVVEEGQPLTVRFVTPSAGQTVGGAVPVTAEATGGAALTYTFTADGTTFATGSSASASWDSRAAANGPHDLGVKVTGSGRTAEASVRVTVSNQSLPAAPSQLTAAALTNRRVQLTWRDNSSNEAGFAIERSRDGRTFTEVTRVGANVTTFTDSGLLRATDYWYRVRSFNAAGASSYSNTVRIRTRLF